jgi:hypothetical protein
VTSDGLCKELRDDPDSPLHNYRDVQYYQRLARDHPAAEWVGNLGGDAKKGFVARARALLMPIRWEEPFGRSSGTTSSGWGSSRPRTAVGRWRSGSRPPRWPGTTSAATRRSWNGPAEPPQRPRSRVDCSTRPVGGREVGRGAPDAPGRHRRVRGQLVPAVPASARRRGRLEAVAAVDRDPASLANARRYLGLPADRCHTSVREALR